jgi:hypothetical protein
MTYWFKSYAMSNFGLKSANIFYEDGVTQDEIDKIRYKDEIETLGDHMQSVPAYGYSSNRFGGYIL